MTRGQAERLFPLVEDLLREAGVGWSDLDGVGVCTGPGNFTGLRVAVAAARGLSLALGIPAAGVTCFEVLAHARPGPVLVTLESRRDGTFAQTFDDGLPTCAAIAGDPAALTPFHPATTCIGYEAQRTAARFGLSAGSASTLVDPVVLAKLAADRLGTARPPVPLYLQPADARPSSDALPALIDDA